jgi:hypothetical protein
VAVYLAVAADLAGGGAGLLAANRYGLFEDFCGILAARSLMRDVLHA